MMDLSKIPPQSIDMEQAVLGALLIYPESINDVMGILTPEMFYKTAHQVIFKSCLEVNKRFGTADLMTITDDLRKHGNLDNVGGPMYLMTLYEKIVSSAQLEKHATIVKEKYLCREYIRISNEIINSAFTEDLDSVVEKAETDILNVASKIYTKEPLRVSESIDKVIAVIEKIQSGEMKLVGTPSGFTEVDRRTGGFKEQELTIIAGRPSMGKTALALQIGKNAASLNYPVGIFSLEMSDSELARRYLSGASGRSNVQLIKGECNIEELIKNTEEFLQMPLFIDDTSAISVTELRAKARKLVLKHGVKMIIVDYLQLMKGEGSSREQEVSSISRGLKSIAKDLNIAVIALSQLNRRLEDTADKKPKLSDLRESGAIEQDADIVGFVYRPAYYNLSTVNINGSDASSANMMFLIISKNRNGAVCEIPLKHNDCLTEIKDYETLTNNETIWD